MPVDLSAPLLASTGTLSVRVTKLPLRGKLLHSNGSILALGDAVDQMEVSFDNASTASAIRFRVLLSDWEDAALNSSILSMDPLTFNFSVSIDNRTAAASARLIPYVPPSAGWQMAVCKLHESMKTCARGTMEAEVAEDSVEPLVLFAGGGATGVAPQIMISRLPAPSEGTLHQAGTCCDPKTFDDLPMLQGEMLVQPRGVVFFVPARDFSGFTSFEYKAVDSSGVASDAASVLVHVHPINDLATPEPPPLIEVLEDSFVYIPLSTYDPEGERTAVFLKSLPKHGALYLSEAGARGPRVLRPHTESDERVRINQFASDVLNFSSSLSVDHEDWHVLQISGERDVSIFGHSPLSFTPRYAGGESDGTATASANQPVTVHGVRRSVSYSWDPVAAFAVYGYSEFIELKYNDPVCPEAVHIGENFGMGSVVGIKARLSSWPAGAYVTLWSGETQPFVQVEYSHVHEYRTFVPSTCQLHTKVDVLRIELDTISVADWNQIDYVRLDGHFKLSDGALVSEHTGVVYVPDKNFYGEDEFGVAVSDCSGVAGRQTPPEIVHMSILPVPDVPIAIGGQVELLHGQEALVGLHVRSMDHDSQPRCIISRSPEAIRIFRNTNASQLQNASVPSETQTNVTAINTCSFRATSLRCGHDSFWFRAHNGDLLSDEADVSVFTHCLPPCSDEIHLTYSLSTCSWLSRQHKVLWAWDSDKKCSPERSGPLPSSTWVPCVRKLSLHTADQISNALLASLLCVVSLVCIIFLAWRSSKMNTRLVKNAVYQLRFVSLGGCFLLSIDMFFDFSKQSHFLCNFHQVIRWTASTFMWAPVTVKLHHLWRVTQNSKLKFIPLESKRTVVPILVYEAVQVINSVLVAFLHPTELRRSSIALYEALEYPYLTCSAATSLTTILRIAQTMIAFVAFVIFVHFIRTPESTDVRTEIQWARVAVYTGLICEVLGDPLLSILYGHNLYVSDLLRTFFCFSRAVAVCLAVVVPSWLIAKTNTPSTRGERPYHAEHHPHGAMSYVELENLVESLSTQVASQTQEVARLTQINLQLPRALDARTPHVGTQKQPDHQSGESVEWATRPVSTESEASVTY